MSKKVLFLIASEGFQQIEYLLSKQEIEKEGFEVAVASDKPGQAVGKDGETKVNVDFLIDDLNLDDFTGMFIIGGPGALKYLDNEKVYKLLNDWDKTNKPYGSICISTRILAKAGVLKGRRAAGWNGDGKLPEILKENGGEFIEGRVYVDGMIVTASGPEAAKDFGQAITKQLKLIF